MQKLPTTKAFVDSFSAALAAGDYVRLTRDGVEIAKLRPAGTAVAAGRQGHSAGGAVAKQTIPSPSVLHFRGGRRAVDTHAYPDMAGFFADLGAAYAEAVQDFARAGCRFQFDAATVRPLARMVREELDRLRLSATRSRRAT